MNDVLHKLKEEARALSSEHQPLFYTRFQTELSFAREMFFDHPMIIRCREDVLPFLSDSYGHGIQHAKKVAIEASAIVLIGGSGLSMNTSRNLSLLAQLCGLLHDICRLDDDHARRGEELARIILQEYPLTDMDKEMICFSIRNHEAFAPVEEHADLLTSLLSDALYDADKFRWGPDNFTTTLWEICDYQEWTLKEVTERFPTGLEMMEQILPTFRTEVGQTFGPEFIQIGLALGKSLYRRLSVLNASTTAT
jgi:hypothetical protein